MERFLVRGYEEKGRKRTQRMRQTRITDAEKVVRYPSDDATCTESWSIGG